MILEAIAAVSAAYLMVVLFPRLWRPRALPNALASRVRDRVVVTTKDGAAFMGVLFDADDKALVLRDAAAVGVAENRTNLPLDGEVIVLTPDVAYLQRLGRE